MQEQEEERRKLRRLQIMMSMVMSVISQDADLSVEEAAELAANAKRAALAMFPDKEFAYDILYKPRLQRLMAERFRLAVGALLVNRGQVDRQRSPEQPRLYLHGQVPGVVAVPDGDFAAILQHAVIAFRDRHESFERFRPAS